MIVYFIFVTTYSFPFTVTLDYKALIMLIKRKDSDGEESLDTLCKRGLDTECCVYWKVSR